MTCKRVLTTLIHGLMLSVLVLLSACGGGKTQKPVVSVNVVGSPVGEVGNGAVSMFSIKGSNLRSAQLVMYDIYNCASDYAILAQTNDEILFRCKPSGLTVYIDVYDRQSGAFIDTVEFNAKSSSDPVITPANTAVAVGTAKAGTLSTFSITGTNLSQAKVTPAFGCIETTLTIASQTSTEIRFSCTPNATEVRANVLNRLNMQVEGVTAAVNPPDSVTLTNVVQAHDTNPVNEPAMFGRSSYFRFTGTNLFSEIHTITAEGCDMQTAVIDSVTSKRIIGVYCTPNALSATFKVVSLETEEALAQYVADFSSLPAAEITVASVQNATSTTPRVSVVGQTSTFRVTGYFDEATALNVTSDGCSNISNQNFDKDSAVFTFTCTPTKFDTTFEITNQDTNLVASLSFPVQVQFSFTIKEGDTTSATKYINVKLDYKNAPVTVANFLAYVNPNFDGKSYYAGTLIHRMLSNVIQGGGYTSVADINTNPKPGLLPAIPLEDTSVTLLSNTRGTIAMARNKEYDSAQAQFFFNTDDNSASYNVGGISGRGYAVFGNVADYNSLTVMDELNSVPVNGELPTKEIRIVDVLRTM